MSNDKLQVATVIDKAQVIETLVTKEYLLSHGFKQYYDWTDDLPCEVPKVFDDYANNAVGYIEKEFHRQMFVVNISNDPIDDVSTFVSVYVQEDAGCGFVQIPFPWSELSVEFFESVYYGIRGEKPKLSK
jgi:hypothetical protein